MNNEASEGIGVEQPRLPSPEELELIPHGYFHSGCLVRMRSEGWAEHGEYEHIGGETMGFFVMMYRL